MSATDVKILVPGNHLMVGLLGHHDELLRLIESAFPRTDITVRGNEISIGGDDADVMGRLFEELVLLLQAGQALDVINVARTIEMVRADERPSEVLTAEVLRGARGRTVRPKTSGQKRYVDAIRDNVITFGIGPAGTGKSWLAVAMAVQALQAKEVNRIILTRPAVEAGERLGFLPGDLMAKVDPYLRPLFDALYDMVDPEGAQRLLERNTVEVAPLAFMRGRAQPVDRLVLTPSGWQAIGNLQVGDLVVGSDGRPTPVLGVYPQGERAVFEVTAQDGASTLCCAEHLWFVPNRGAVVMTRDLQPGDELPVLSSPVEFDPRQASSGHLTPVSGVKCPEPGRRGGTVTEVVARELLWGTPQERRAVLDELLDGSDAPAGDPIRWRSDSPALEDAVVFLVRSLGGIAEPGPDQGSLEIHLPGAGRPMRMIESIEPAGRAETVCIQVGAADSLYVTDDFLVTHNTINEAFIILDEAQNTTPEQMKMFLTRIGFGSKAVITGDVTQVDVPNGRSGLMGLERILTGIEGLAFVKLTNRDVVRHRIVQDIVDAYDRASGDEDKAGKTGKA